MTSHADRPYTRDLRELMHERRPLPGESEAQYFRRVAADAVERQRAERRRRIRNWVLRRDDAAA